MTLRILPAFSAADGELEEISPTADSFQINAIALVGASPDITGLPATPPGATSAASKAYVDALANGLDWKNSARVATAADLPANTPAGSGVGKTITITATGILAIDGVNTVLGDRILVKDYGGGASSVHNGLYEVTVEGEVGVSAVLTRTDDADEDAEVTAGLAVFAEEGTTNADRGYVLTTNDPIVVDTAALEFVQFTAAVATVLTAGAGLLDTADTWSVELDEEADAQGAGVGGGSSGLEYDAAGDGGELRVAVGLAGAINRSAGGLIVELDGNSLSTTAAGIKVGHSPKGQEELVVGETVAAFDPVAWGFSADKLAKGDAADISESRVMGIAAAAILADATGTIVRSGLMPGALSGATVGAPQYLASGGGITETLPVGNVNRVRVGYAKSATELDVRIEYLGRTGSPAA